MKYALLFLMMMMLPVLTHAQDVLPETYNVNGGVVTDESPAGIGDIQQGSDKDWFMTSGYTASSFGSGAQTTITRMKSRLTGMQFSTGFVNLNSGTSNLSGGGRNGAMIPVFVGLRHNLVMAGAGSMTMACYASYGAGPVLGMEYGSDLGLTSQFGSLGFRWGGGAYAGLGLDLAHESMWAVHMQVEYDGLGFTAPLAGRSTYLGPSFLLWNSIRALISLKMFVRISRPTHLYYFWSYS